MRATRILGAVLALLLLSCAPSAADTQTMTVGNTWTDLGYGPLLAENKTTATAEVLSSATNPGVGAYGKGHILSQQTGQPFRQFDTMDHLWARATGATVTLGITRLQLGAQSPVPVTHSASLEGGRLLKSSPGTLASLSVTLGNAAGFLMIMDSASAVPDGSVSYVYCYAVPGQSTVAIQWSSPVAFSNGIYVAFSSTGCSTKTESPQAIFSAQVR